MRRFAAIMLVVLLLASVALAEGVDAVNAYVAQQGYKAMSVKNKSKLSGCWFATDAAGDTLQWSDNSRMYTVTAKAGSDLMRLYGELVEMSDWDSCSFSADGKVQFAFNAPEVDAVKSYKTLRNYARYVGEYIDENAPSQPAKAGKTGRQTYVLNKGSKKFHTSDCPFSYRIKKENKDTYKGSREDLIEMGYEPCKKCNP